MVEGRHFGSALATSRSHPLAVSSFPPRDPLAQRTFASEVYGPPKVTPLPTDWSKVAGKPSGFVPEYRVMQRVAPMSYERPTYNIIKRNNDIPGRESAKALIYSGVDETFPQGDTINLLLTLR